MPHLRFTRDKRGYEITALLTSGGARRRGHQQRLLYFFRTPPGVRVGRAPIDEDAIHLLEQHNPDVQFDWTRILKQPPLQEQGRREDRREGRHEERRPQDRPPAASQQLPASSHQLPASSHQLPASSRQASANGSDSDDDGFQPPDEAFVELGEVQEPAEEPERLEAGGWQLEAGNQPEPLTDGSWKPEAGNQPPETVPDRYSRLGAEGLARLRARYAEVMARIADRPLEEDAREQLKLKAERLNPDAWVTTDEVAAALEQYETVFEELRGIVGRQPRRHRRRRV